MPAVRVEGLTKTYGETRAVRGIDFDIDTGEVVAILGPNGAGKTTKVEILEGFRRVDAGHVEVLGRDPVDRDRDASTGSKSSLRSDDRRRFPLAGERQAGSLVRDRIGRGGALLQL